ncbi:MAG: transposase [Bacteroidota bacterium]
MIVLKLRLSKSGIDMDRLEAGFYYHIYNRGNNSQSICRSPQDYKKFLELLFYYLYPAFEIYAYCLLSNHYHLLVKVNTDQEQIDKLNNYSDQALDIEFSPYGYQYDTYKVKKPSFLLSHLFNSFTKYFNDNYQRTGNLFEGSYKRIQISNLDYLTELATYIHRNPIHHGISDDFDTYPYSSYRYFLDSTFPLLRTDEAIQWFGDQDNFIAAHIESESILNSKLLFE